MALSDVNTAMTAALAALAAGDYATAMNQAMAAQGYLAILPDQEHGQSITMEWDRRSIDQFIVNVRKREARAAAVSAGGIQRTKIVHAQPSAAE